MAIGYSIGFICCFAQSNVKRALNSSGVVDSNSVLFNFLIPGIFASIFSAILQGIGETFISGKFTKNTDPNRTFVEQGGFQIIGVLIAIGLGAGAGIIIGLIYKFVGSISEQK